MTSSSFTQKRKSMNGMNVMYSMNNVNVHYKQCSKRSHYKNHCLASQLLPNQIEWKQTFDHEPGFKTTFFFI